MGIFIPAKAQIAFQTTKSKQLMQKFPTISVQSIFK